MIRIQKCLSKLDKLLNECKCKVFFLDKNYYTNTSEVKVLLGINSVEKIWKLTGMKS